AREHSYRARSAFKLIEINNRYRFINPVENFNPMIPITGVDLITMADITSPETHRQIKQYLNGRSVDAVVSDMAPNPSGEQNLVYF
uniref:rRNA methyltransferase 2, mitochondrial n=1 Tax=Parascaris equorum TaxID=6256 RepID=A0A914R3F5_PAREQ